MRFAIFSDIHSNVFALEAVIEDAQKSRVDLMVNLGDILYGPIAPKATFELLMHHKMPTISGNQDRQIVEASATEIAANPTMQFIVEELGQEPISWMASLPFELQISDEVYLCHGTPESDLVYLLEDVSKGFAQLRSDQEITKLLGKQKSKLICCGHTHTPRTVHLSSGQIVVNPGSVGLQAYTDEEPVPHSMENFHSMASYAIAENSIKGWTVRHIRVPYDLESALAACKKRSRLDWAHYLSTGRKI